MFRPLFFFTLTLSFFFSSSLLFASEKIQQIMEKMTLEEKVAQMLIVGFRGTTVSEAKIITKNIKVNKLGGVILFDYDIDLRSPVRNIVSPKQVETLTHDLQSLSTIPLLVAIDQEGGRIRRLKEEHGFLPTLSHGKLGRINHLDVTVQASALIAGTLKSVGINLNLAPVVDVNINPDNPIIAKYDRSFSADPTVVYKQAKSFIEGHDYFNVGSVLKHFPGHGSSLEDSHLGLPDVTTLWQEKELIPYEKLIGDNKVSVIMSAHLYNQNLDPKLPASLSKLTLKNLLRDKLGFKGLIVSDDMNMQAITKHYGLKEAVILAIQATTDILIFANNFTYDPKIVSKVIKIVKEAVAKNKISEKQINASVFKILQLKKKLTPSSF